MSCPRIPQGIETAQGRESQTPGAPFSIRPALAFNHTAVSSGTSNPSEEILREEKVDNRPERERKEKRRKAAVKRGANFVGTALQRFTVRSVKFLRWVRNFLYRDTPWEHAIARLRHVYVAYG